MSRDRPTFGSDKHPLAGLEETTVIGVLVCMIVLPPFMRMRRGKVWRTPMLNNTVNHRGLLPSLNPKVNGVVFNIWPFNPRPPLFPRLFFQ